MSAAHDPLRPPDPSAVTTDGRSAMHFTKPGAKFALWTGVLGGAIAWAVQMLLVYALARFTHEHRWLAYVQHAVSLSGALLALCAAAIALRQWRRLGGNEAQASDEDIAGRARFMAALGILTSTLFALVIVAQWLPSFFLDPGWY